ncbi:MAG TPA: hypothetical protein VHC22_00940 [Pirellulales bacterium]|nr:hypothetical protein [Pirellulales bacterium]
MLPRWVGGFNFSLGRLLAVITFVTLLSSHVVTSWKLHQARDEMGRMATELGRLTISDPSVLNVVARKSYEDLIWRWRVHVPAGREYRIFSANRGR